MKILIIGGTGVLSTDILRRSTECAYDVSVLNRGNHNSQIQGNVTIYKADIRNIAEVDASLGNAKFDVVVDFLSFNVNDLKATFGYFRNRCKQYIYISSACVFRRRAEDGIILEDSPKPNRDLPYSVKKYECEQWLLRNAKETDCKYTVVRPYITYGDTRIPFGIAPAAGYHWTIVSRINCNKPMFLWDGGIARCTLMHSKDFAYNFVQLYLNDKAYNEDINLVGDYVYSWRAMLEILYDILGGDKNNIVSIPTEQIALILPCYRDFLVGDRSLNAVFDNSKLKRCIPNFRQNIALREGMSETLNYYASNSCLNGIDYGYDGRVDKLIERVCKCRLRFVDYLKSRSIRDKISYYVNKHLSDSQLRGLHSALNKLRFK